MKLIIIFGLLIIIFFLLHFFIFAILLFSKILAIINKLYALTADLIYIYLLGIINKAIFWFKFAIFKNFLIFGFFGNFGLIYYYIFILLGVGP